MPTTAVTSAVSGNPKNAFNADQRKLLDVLLPEFEAFVEANNPSHEQRCKAVTDWKKSKATELMKEAPFQAVLNPLEDSTAPQVTAEYADWNSAIRCYFTNYYNNKYLRQIHRQSTSRISTAATVPATIGWDSNSTPENPAPDSKKLVRDFLRRAFIIFSSELSVRELFAKENKELVKIKMREISDDFPDLTGGPLRQKALKLLWEDEDHEKWEARLRDLQNDVHGNQEEFEFLMFAALEDLCARKRLGSTMMSFSYAFRDAEDGLNNNTIYMGYNAETDEIISATPSASDRETMLNAWAVFADSQIPRGKRYVPVYTIPRNDDGLPVMPLVDLTKANPEQISILLHDFLLAVWEHSPHSKITPAIPWERISESPNLFIDDAIFKLPIPFSNPKDLALNPMALYSLHGYLSSISATTPFQFRSDNQTVPNVTPGGSEPPPPPHGINSVTHVTQHAPAPPMTPTNHRTAEKPSAQSQIIMSVTATGSAAVRLSAVDGNNPGTDEHGTVGSHALPLKEVADSESHVDVDITPPALPGPVKTAPKRGRGRPKGVKVPTRASSRAKAPEAVATGASAPDSEVLKRKASTSDKGIGGSKKKARTWYEYRNADNELVNEHSQRIDENGNLILPAPEL